LLRNFHQFQGLSLSYSRPCHFGANPSICNQRSLTYVTNLTIFFYLGARPFGQYLPETSASSAIPNHLLQWLAQRQSRITTTTEKTLQGLPLGDDGGDGGNLGSLEAVVSKDQQVKKPSLRSAPVADDTLKGLTKLGSSPKPKLIQRPAYNPELARKDGEVESDNTTKGTYPVTHHLTLK
jgi:hypothetical protein